MIIQRNLQKELEQAAKEMPVVALLGPRQTGKTTLAQLAFPDHQYVNLEDLQVRKLAKEDPTIFLEQHAHGPGIILDEIQHVPSLLSAIQVLTDRQQKNGFFILTGSQNLSMHESITQSLAGRIAELTLLPLSIDELSKAEKLPPTVEELTYHGCYPRLYSQELSAERLYKNYINTYIERDVRRIKNIHNLSLFQDFLQACAARTGQLMNLSSLCEDLDITQNTAKSWLSLLEASYIVFLLRPYHKKYGKMLVKTPKLYFIDTGLACSLLGIKNPQEISHSYLRGALIETLIIGDLYKQLCNLDKDPKKTLYFWRDHSGHEIDALLNQQSHPTALEIKSGKTVTSQYFSSITKWNKLTKTTKKSNYIIYSGEQSLQWPNASVLSWRASGTIVEKILRPKDQLT